MNTKEEIKEKDSDFLTRADIAQTLGVSYGAIRIWEKRPDFPKPFIFSSAVKRWKRQEIIRWADSCQSVNNER